LLIYFMFQGLGLRPGVIDGAISISAVQVIFRSCVLLLCVYLIPHSLFTYVTSLLYVLYMVSGYAMLTSLLMSQDCG
jgi:hypothetical protein